MRTLNWKRPRLTASGIAALLVALVIVVVILASVGLRSSGSGFVEMGPTIGLDDLGALHIGTLRSQIENRYGKGADALDYPDSGLPDTGAAVEPMDATCVYYPQTHMDVRALVQLCYRANHLVSKRAYGPTAGPPFRH